MDAHKVGLSLVMASNHGGVLLSFMQHLSHIHVTATQLHDNFGRLGLAITGAFSIVAGTKLLETMGDAIEKGNQLVRVQQNMAQAGVTAVEIQKANAKAWELTRENMNMSVVDVLRLQEKGRTIFGDMPHSEEAMPAIVNQGSFLRAYQGKEKGAATHEAFMRELESTLKSGELAAKLTVEEMKDHIGNLTAMKVLYGDQVKIGAYLNAQRRGGASLRNTSDEFRYGIFPALVQEQKQNAGVQMMTAFQKIVAGTTNTERAYNAMLELGIAGGETVEERKTLRGKTTRKPRGSGIIEPGLFAKNPLQWVEEVLKPKLDIKTGGNNPILESQWIGRAFPDRNAQMFLTELLQQRTKLHKDAGMLQEVNREFGGYKNKSWEYQTQAFKTQWEVLITALGAPAVAKATEYLRTINGYLADLVVYASKKENAEFLMKFAQGMGWLAAGLIAGGGAAIVVAMGTIGGVVLLITILAGIMGTIDWPKEWAKFKQNLSDLHAMVEEWTNKWNDLKDSAIQWASGQLSDFATWITETQTRWDETKTKMGENIAAIPTKIIETVKTWPEKIKASIIKMGEDLLGRITAFLQAFREGAGRVTPDGVPWGQINYTPGGEPGYGQPGFKGFASTVTGTKSERAMKMIAMLRGMGWSQAGAASAAAQALTESQFDPTIIGDKKLGPGREAHGLFQWRESRWQALQAFAAREGKHWSDFETQVRFFNYEVGQKADKLRLHGWKTATDPAAASSGFGYRYEGYAGPPQSHRGRDAQALFESYRDAARTPPPRRNPPVEVDTTVKLDGRRVSDDKQYEARRKAPAQSMAA